MAAAAPAAAGNFSVSPIRVELSAGQPTAVITVHNNDAAPLLVQASMLAWTQPGGEEKYVESRDLISTPPVFTLPPDGDQIIRVALRRGADPSRELSYRLMLAEVPPAAAPDFTGLRVALRLSLPVFVKPAAAASANLAWQAKRSPDGSLVVSATNNGTAHSQVTDFELKFPDQPEATKVAVARYVLPGSTVNWTVSSAAASRATRGSIRGFSSTGEFQADIDITGP